MEFFAISQYKNRAIDKAILDDLTDYARANNIPLGDIVSKEYGENRDGMRALHFIQKLPSPRDSEIMVFVLFYDQNNVRVKVKSWSDRNRS